MKIQTLLKQFFFFQLGIVFHGQDLKSFYQNRDLFHNIRYGKAPFQNGLGAAQGQYCLRLLLAPCLDILSIQRPSPRQLHAYRVTTVALAILQQKENSTRIDECAFQMDGFLLKRVRAPLPYSNSYLHVTDHPTRNVSEIHPTHNVSEIYDSSISGRTAAPRIQRLFH